MDIELPLLIENGDQSSPFVNRLRKNYRHLRKWAKRTSTNAFRIYDRDIKEYPLAIDFYDGRFCIHYFSFDKDMEGAPKELSDEVESALKSLFDIAVENLFWRTRLKREKMQQYEKNDESSDFFTILEHGVKFKVNLKDYLDTGLFLDHRETRQMVAKAARNKRLLNLFAYTCSFSVQAAAHGSLYTKSVDLSNTYTAWGRDNFLLNGLSLRDNIIIRSDYRKFLQEEIKSKVKYDVIVIDPPTLSRSKKMEKMFDIQEDYVPLLKDALKLLTQDGLIFFSTNFRKFQFNENMLSECEIRDISHKTIPLDFHNKKIHSCWTLTLRH